MRQLKTIVIALMVLIVGASCSDDDLTAQGIFAGQLAALNSRMSDINMAAMTDIDLPDEVLAALLAGYQGDVPGQMGASAKGVTNLGGEGWNVSLAGVDIDTASDTYLGFVAVGFRTSNGTLEAFLFLTDDLFPETVGIDPLIYIENLYEEDLVTDNMLVGSGTLTTQNRGDYVFGRDDCDVGPASVKGTGPFIGEYTHDLEFNISGSLSSLMASPDFAGVKALGTPFDYPDFETFSELITMPGFYYWDVCMGP